MMNRLVSRSVTLWESRGSGDWKATLNAPPASPVSAISTVMLRRTCSGVPSPKSFSLESSRSSLKIVVVMAGTNNVGRNSPLGDAAARGADVARGVAAIVGEIRQRAPEATVIVTGITPRNDNRDVNTVIDDANARIAKLADGKTIRYININDVLADPQGNLRPGMVHDGLHLTAQSYQVWADHLKPIFTEILGTPAASDQAPPPTGDPSVTSR